MTSQTFAIERELASRTVDRHNDAGEVLGTVTLEPEIFGRAPNVPLMHQVVTAQLAARRAGTQSTKTRAEVAGGGAKPYRQKGTGRARQGTIRAPQFAGGGVALGPKPRSYAQRTPRKMTRLALFSALSDRAAEGKVCLVDSWSFGIPKTKDALKALDALGLEGSILVVLGSEDTIAERSFANLPEVDLVEASQLTAYDVLVNDWIVFTDATLPGSVTEAPPSAAAQSAAAQSAAASSASAPGESGASSDDTPAAADESTDDAVDDAIGDASVEDESDADVSAEAGAEEEEAEVSPSADASSDSASDDDGDDDTENDETEEDSE